jgi:hypothetical protein
LVIYFGHTTKIFVEKLNLASEKMEMKSTF